MHPFGVSHKSCKQQLCCDSVMCKKFLFAASHCLILMHCIGKHTSKVAVFHACNFFTLRRKHLGELQHAFAPIRLYCTLTATQTISALHSWERTFRVYMQRACKCGAIFLTQTLENCGKWARVMCASVAACLLRIYPPTCYNIFHAPAAKNFRCKLIFFPHSRSSCPAGVATRAPNSFLHELCAIFLYFFHFIHIHLVNENEWNLPNYLNVLCYFFGVHLFVVGTIMLAITVIIVYQ